MSGTIRREELRRALADGVDVERLAEDPRATLAQLERADRDHDGRIEGEREIDAVFSLLDRYDGRRDGRVTVVGRDGSQTGAAHAVAALADAADTAAVETLRALARTGDARASVAFVGVTEGSVDEARALARRAPVLLATDRADHADVARGDDGALRALSTSAGRGWFVRSLGLPEDVAARVKTVLAQTEHGARREIALLAQMWAPAYRGEPIPERLVISGHGNGRAFLEWDDEEIADTRFRDLARAMPQAAAEVRSIELAACQHGYDTRMATLRDAFPNVTSMWGYAGFSPTAGAAIAHQTAWERATHAGAPDAAAVANARRSVHGTRRAENVAIWTREGGWAGPAQRELGVIMRELDVTRAAYVDFFEGNRPLPDPMRGELATRYQQLQEVAAHSDLADQTVRFREVNQQELDVTLRLRYFERTVTEAFDRHHRGAIEAGYGAIGLEPPSFVGMTRRAVREEIARFRGALDATETQPRAARTLLDLLESGLWRLSPEVIPTTWI